MLLAAEALKCETFLYVKQLAAGVAWLHGCGVAHCDLKLENALLLRRGHVVIADLGLGVDVSTLAQSGGLSNIWCGTRTTMAPEIYDNVPYDPRTADMWSLGVMALALVAPRTPDEYGYERHGFYAWSVADVKVDWAYDQYEMLQHANASLRSMINSSLVSWPAGVPQPTAIASLLQASDEHYMPKQLPPALLLVLDGMLRTDPGERICAADVYSLLAPLLE